MNDEQTYLNQLARQIVREQRLEGFARRGPAVVLFSRWRLGFDQLGVVLTCLLLAWVARRSY